MPHASITSANQASLFARRGKRFVAGLVPSPPDKKMRLATQQEPEKEKVMARRSSDESGLFSAEVPNGPFRTCPVTTEAVALPLHSHLVAPDKPTVVAQTARKRRNLICYLTDSQWHDAVFLLKCAPSTRASRQAKRLLSGWEW